MDLRALRRDAADALEDLFEAFDPGLPGEALLEVHDELASAFLTVAVASLLVDGNVTAYHLNLVRCAENGRRLLALLRRRSLPLPAASRNVPLLAALAAGDFPRADATAASSRTDRDESADEYEEEFLWARCLQLLARSGGDKTAATEPVLAALSREDGAGSRVAFVRALLARDPAGLAAAFADAHAEHEAEVEERAKSFATPVTSFAPHRFIWLEGLALLRLAERDGLPVEGEHRYCPPLALLNVGVSYEGDWALATGAEG